MFLQAVRSILYASVPTTFKNADLKVVLSVIIDAETQLSDKYCQRFQKEGIQVEIRFHFEIISSANALFRILRDYFILKECHVQDTRAPRSYPKTLQIQC